MATDSPNSSNNMASLYLKNPSSSSYPEASNLPSNMTMYMNFSSSTQSYSDTLAENSHSQQNFIEIPSMGTSESTLTRQETLSNPFNSHLREQDYGIQRDGGNEMLFMQPMGGTIRNSKYLEVAQELLDEVVNVRKALKKPDSENHQSFHGNGLKSFKETDEKSRSGSILPHMNGVPSNTQDSTVNLSPAERHDIQNKLTKLLSMLDEVDKRYRQYHHQMQIVISSFDMIARCGAAKPYTALAFQTISQHFRGLRDAISGQIQETRRSLGEQDSSVNSKECGISRLRYVDQQLRQQKALQQLGMMQQHAWRPQRGLPESSVSILRAWLFEHFLHPYPKDSDKIMLARQAGLTRGQVSNWFINARVRLWKPMVEEMYKEEFVDMEMESNSSSENAARDNIRTSKDGEIEFHQSINSTVIERNHPGKFHNSKSDPNPEEEMGGSTPGKGFQNEAHGENEINYGILKMREDHRTNVNYTLFQNALVQPDHSSGERYMSLTLGLQHCDNGGIPVSDGTNHNFFTMREDEIYNTATSSVEPNAADYDYIDLGNQRYRFGSTRLLHDFVA